MSASTSQRAEARAVCADFRRFSCNSPAVWRNVVEQNRLQRAQMVVGDIKQVEFEPGLKSSIGSSMWNCTFPHRRHCAKFTTVSPARRVVVDDVGDSPLFDAVKRPFQEFVATIDGV